MKNEMVKFLRSKLQPLVRDISWAKNVLKELDYGQ